MHAPLPPGLRGPVVGYQQEVSNMPGWHRNTAEPRQLMGFDSLLIHSVLWDSSLSSISAQQPSPDPHASFSTWWVLCQMSPDFTRHEPPPPLINALLSQARTAREATKDSLYIEAHPLGTQTTLEHKTTHFLMYTGFTCSLLVVSGVLLQLWCCTVGSHGLCSMSSKPWLYVCRAVNTWTTELSIFSSFSVFFLLWHKHKLNSY